MKRLLAIFFIIFFYSFRVFAQCDADHTVILNNFEFVPSELVIVPGESVAFINIEGIHNLNGINNSITGDNFSNPVDYFLEDSSGSPNGICMGVIEFDTPGIYNFDSSYGFDAQSGMSLIIINLLVGCTDIFACNFGANIIDDDSSCYYAETYYDCDGNCINDSDGDGVCNELEAAGCTDIEACNFSEDATDNDGSCIYAQEYYYCGGNCINDSDEDGICDELEVLGCTSEWANNYDEFATDDDGNWVGLQIGDQYAGGIVFQINEDGTGLVADLQDLEQMNWWDAMDAAESVTSQGYDDWYLPSIEELELMYSMIGNGGTEGNIGGFNYSYYWSSSEYGSYGAWRVGFGDGGAGYGDKGSTGRVRVIRAF